MKTLKNFTVKNRTDVISAHLQLRRILLEDWLEKGYLTETRDRHKKYKLELESSALKKLVKFGEIDALVSFQVTKDGNFAIARLFTDPNPNKDNLNKDNSK